MEYLSLEERELGGPYHSQALWLSDPIHEIQIYFASELSMHDLYDNFHEAKKDLWEYEKKIKMC